MEPVPPTILRRDGEPRYELTSLDDGGVLIDTETGYILSLNHTALEIWAQFLRGESPLDIALELERQYSVPRDQAHDDVLQVLSPPRPAANPHERFRHECHPDGRYFATLDGVRILELLPTGSGFHLLHPLPASNLYPLLRGIAPKLLALSGQIVLHASCVRRGREAMAFLGASGAGKTTTARAFGEHGARILAEDVLAIHRQDDQVFVAEGFEEAINQWAKATSLEFDLDTGTAIELPRPASLVDGDTTPISGVHFLDRERRIETILARKRLSIGETTALLFSNSFISSPDRSVRRVQIAQMASIARAVPGYAMTVPNGLSELARAASDPAVMAWRE